MVDMLIIALAIGIPATLVFIIIGIFILDRTKQRRGLSDGFILPDDDLVDGSPTEVLDEIDGHRCSMELWTRKSSLGHSSTRQAFHGISGSNRKIASITTSKKDTPARI